MPDALPPWAGTRSPLSGNDRGRDWILDRAIECASEDRVRELSGERWRRQRRYVATQSAFYRHKYGDGGGLESIGLGELTALPFTTKEELQAAQDEAPPYGSQLATGEPIARSYQTSGTGGRPTAIALTAADVAAWTEIGHRSYHTLGVRAHNTVLSTFSATPYVVGFTHEVVEGLGARLLAPGLRNIDGALAALEHEDVDTLLSTPSTAAYLRDRMTERGGDVTAAGVIHLILGGEPGAGPGAPRARFEEAYGAVVTEAMGTGDIAPSLFAECPAQQGMHFSAQGLVWPELVDDTGTPVPITAGAEGELVYTHLRRQAMPLVRFRSRDRVTVATTDCPCGRTSFAVRVLGRTDDMFIVKGVNVYPSAVQAVVTEAAPEATGRIRFVPAGSLDAAQPGAPTRIVVELRPGVVDAPAIATRLERAIHDRLRFRAYVDLVPAERFGDAGYKTVFLEDGGGNPG